MIWQLGLLLLLACAGITFAYLRQDAERALFVVKRSCQEARLQWLDQAVHLHGIQLIWRSGPLLRRDYRFACSVDGQQRNRGYLRLEGPHLLWLFVETDQGSVYLHGA